MILKKAKEIEVGNCYLPIEYKKQIILLLHSLEELNDIQAITTDYRNGFIIKVDSYNKEKNILFIKNDFDKVDESLEYLIIRSAGGEYDSNIYSLANRKQIEFKTAIIK
jgi:hypothetical protein